MPNVTFNKFFSKAYNKWNKFNYSVSIEISCFKKKYKEGNSVYRCKNDIMLQKESNAVSRRIDIPLKRRNIMRILIMILMAMVMTTGTLYGQTTDQPPPIPSEEQPEVLTRGPVNEAFAQPVNLEQQSGFIVPKAPPADIEETLPAEMPVGQQFAWVPGYWAWDSDRNEHIWVSGCWRAVPPGKYWIPGYWAEATEGWRWVAGFWAPVSNKEIEYLPAPPAVTYVRPPETASYSDKIWVPACWYWSHGRYTLRTGYWIAARQDWVWVPSHYVWTPRGYVFVSGHWDYSLRRRGVLFAPVYFPGHIYGRARLSYSLSIVLDIGNLEFGLFTRPAYHHYYFGDYYDSFYMGVGIFPWFEVASRHTWYDPIYLHDRWRHRRDEPRWEQHERREYERRRADKSLRSPRTYREMERRVSNMPESRRRNFEVAVPMKRIVEKKTTTFKFRKIKPEDRKKISGQTGDLHKYVRERRQWESPVTVRKTDRPVRERAPSSERREMQVPMKRKGSEMKPSERMESSRPERVCSGEAPARGRESSTTSPGQKESSKASQPEVEQGKSDNVKVRTSPVIDKQKGKFFRKKQPAQPDEEQAEQKGKKKRNDRR